MQFCNREKKMLARAGAHIGTWLSLKHRFNHSSGLLVKTTLLIPSAAAAALLALAGCSSLPILTRQTAPTSTYPPTDPATVQILRQAPTQPHVKLGELTALPQSSSTPFSEIEAKLRQAGAKLGAHAIVLLVETAFTPAAATSEWWDRQHSPNVGQVFIGVPIRYTGQKLARGAQAP